jgi:ribosomal protein S18 acetylase RimI-like enzyme
VDAILVSQIAHWTAEYQATVRLRREVLRAPLGLDFTREELERECADFHLACYDGDELVGCLVLMPQGSEIIKMRQVAVAPHVQRRGVGRALTAFAEKFAREQNFSVMTLHARTSAVAFYEKLGYERVGEEFEEVTIPHWEMRKGL